ncbi:MAG TPA: pyrroline-5-carboxylate reductase [Geobacteraceae bacterium]|nr:pyrroline-5-carboxylate reductase [Geobacteraceae bacterium]
MLKDKTIGFIGGGNMAEALIKGLMAGGTAAASIFVAEPQTGRREFIAERYGVKCYEENSAVVTGSNVVVLAVKPQVAETVLREMGKIADAGKLFISIMAGVKIATMEEALLDGARVVRVMPNTPALVLEAASAIAPGTKATAEDISTARAIFELVGKAWQVDEKLMDAVTGLSGSGPAYVLTFIEAFSDAGVKNGLSRDIATGLAAQTVFGTAKLLLETGEHPAVLRDKVTSPGGTTIAGLHMLEKVGFRGTLINAVDAATARSRELGQK